MKVLLLGGAAGQGQANPNDKAINSGIEAWCHAFEDSWYSCGATATPDFIQQFDLIIGNSNHIGYTDNLLRLQQARRSDTKWVTMIEGCGRYYLEWEKSRKALLAGGDLVNVINRHTLDYFRALSGVRCEYVGIPYPAEQIRAKYRRSPEAKGVFVPPLYRDRAQASVLASLSFTKRNDLTIHGIDSELPAFGDSVIEIHSERNQQNYYELLAREAWAFVDLDERYTWKRNVLDCAAIGVPCISTVSGGQAQKFFPHLQVGNAFSVTEAEDLLELLYTDKGFYDEMADVSLDKFADYTHDVMREKLLAAL